MKINPAFIALRSAGPEDSEFCYQVKKAALGEYIAQVWGWNEAFQREFHRRDFAEGRPDIVVYDGQEAGTFRVARHATHWHIAEFYLLPQFQRKGIGSALLQRTIDAAHSAGLAVRLEVLKINPARRLYERHGFCISGETETHYLMQTEVLSNKTTL